MIYKLCILFLLASCSNFRRRLITSSAVGGVIGATGGVIFSPEKEFKSKNAFLFGALGAFVGGGISYLLDDSQKKNKIDENLLIKEKDNKELNLPMFDFGPELKGIKPKVDFKPINKYKVPTKKLPPELKGKVKKQFIIEYQSETKTLKIGNRTIEIGPFKAWEHVYEE